MLKVGSVIEHTFLFPQQESATGKPKEGRVYAKVTKLNLVRQSVITEYGTNVSVKNIVGVYNSEEEIKK